jgi:hypothetical protein
LFSVALLQQGTEVRQVLDPVFKEPAPVSGLILWGAESLLSSLVARLAPWTRERYDTEGFSSCQPLSRRKSGGLFALVGWRRDRPRRAASQRLEGRRNEPASSLPNPRPLSSRRSPQATRHGGADSEAGSRVRFHARFRNSFDAARRLSHLRAGSWCGGVTPFTDAQLHNARP